MLTVTQQVSGRADGRLQVFEEPWPLDYAAFPKLMKMCLSNRGLTFLPGMPQISPALFPSAAAVPFPYAI